jgi:hypothetical protein
MAEPWTHRDERGNELTIGTAEGLDGVCWLRVERESRLADKWAPSAIVTGLEIPDVTNAMWRAAGQEPPVMLGRPDVDAMRDAGGWVSLGGVNLRESARGVSVAIGGCLRTLSAAQTRQLAAVAVAMADEPPVPEPDPAEVGEIAALIYQAMYPGYAPEPGERALEAARPVLLRMRDRGADR